MVYFSGFCLEQEQDFFKKWLNGFDVAGFSYGAIKACEYALDNSCKRLALISPAFFSCMNDEQKQKELALYKKSPKLYVRAFFSKISENKICLKNHTKISKLSDLEKLLYYEWNASLIKSLIARGIKIEVFIALNDKIICVNRASEFFRPLVEVHIIKDVGHILH